VPSGEPPICIYYFGGSKSCTFYELDACQDMARRSGSPRPACIQNANVRPNPFPNIPSGEPPLCIHYFGGSMSCTFYELDTCQDMAQRSGSPRPACIRNPKLGVIERTDGVV